MLKLHSSLKKEAPREKEELGMEGDPPKDQYMAIQDFSFYVLVHKSNDLLVEFDD